MRSCRLRGAGPAATRRSGGTSSRPIRCTTSSRRGRCAERPRRHRPPPRTARPGRSLRFRPYCPCEMGLISEDNSHARSLSPIAAMAITVQMALCVYWPPFSRTPGHVALDVAGIEVRFVERRIEQQDQTRASRRTSRRSTLSIARRVRCGVPAPERIDQLCEIASIWHSSFVAEPSGVPSSKYARRYHSPSQPCSSILPRSRPASTVYRSASAVSPRRRARRRTA